MMIGTNSSGRKTITFRNLDGSYVGTMSYSTRTSSSSSSTKKKKLNYSFKQISNRIMRAKTSGNAGQVVTQARQKLAQLYGKRRSGEYDDKELEDAILHAEAMVRVAKKRKKHLMMEELAKGKNSRQIEDDFEEKLEEKMEDSREDLSAFSEDELRELTKRLQKEKSAASSGISGSNSLIIPVFR